VFHHRNFEATVSFIAQNLVKMRREERAKYHQQGGQHANAKQGDGPEFISDNPGRDRSGPWWHLSNNLIPWWRG
jgi:hypothetical protein